MWANVYRRTFAELADLCSCAKWQIIMIFNWIQLDSKQKEILNNKEKVGDHKERIDAINDHLKNVVQELQHTQVILANSSNIWDDHNRDI